MNTSFETSKMNGKEEWLTPPAILHALGSFDLDPCAPPLPIQPWNTAKIRYSLPVDGLSQTWAGRVWCNPPYVPKTGLWLHKCSTHGNAIALTFARTGTAMFHQYVYPVAHALLFIKGRIRFYHVSGIAGGTPGADSVLIAYGPENAEALKNSRLKGAYIALR